MKTKKLVNTLYVAYIHYKHILDKMCTSLSLNTVTSTIQWLFLSDVVAIYYMKGMNHRVGDGVHCSPKHRQTLRMEKPIASWGNSYLEYAVALCSAVDANHQQRTVAMSIQHGNHTTPLPLKRVLSASNPDSGIRRISCPHHIYRPWPCREILDIVVE